MAFKLEVAAGQSRSGKSWETHRRTKAAKNLFAWDTMAEWGADFRCKPVTTANELRAIAARGAPGRFAFAVPVTPANFDLFCRCAFTWLQILAHRRQRVTLIIEELADVTPPGKAPQAWGEVIRKSLRFEPEIYALTQAPAESDKTVMRNATAIRCHSMGRDVDRRAMARELDVDLARIESIDFARYQYIERDQLTRHLYTAGKGMARKKV